MTTEIAGEAVSNNGSSFYLGAKIESGSIVASQGFYYHNQINDFHVRKGQSLMLAGKSNGTGDFWTADSIEIHVNGEYLFGLRFTTFNSGQPPRTEARPPFDMSKALENFAGQQITLGIKYKLLSNESTPGSSGIFAVYTH